MFKELKKGGFAGAKARYNLRIMLGAAAFIAVAAVLCVLSGGYGAIAGAAFAVAPVFAIPAGLEVSDNEKKGLEAWQAILQNNSSNSPRVNYPRKR